MLTSLMKKRIRVKGEEGFTLVELLVVIIIIAILAAIAIPMYLRQREKGWRAAMESDLRNAAVAQESYYNGPVGTYTNVLANLTANGYKATSGVTLTVPVATASRYCMEATHSNLAGETKHFDSNDGVPSSGACPP